MAYAWPSMTGPRSSSTSSPTSTLSRSSWPWAAGHGRGWRYASARASSGQIARPEPYAWLARPQALGAAKATRRSRMRERSGPSWCKASDCLRTRLIGALLALGRQTGDLKLPGAGVAGARTPSATHRAPLKPQATPRRAQPRAARPVSEHEDLWLPVSGSPAGAPPCGAPAPCAPSPSRGWIRAPARAGAGAGRGADRRRFAPGRGHRRAPRERAA